MQIRTVDGVDLYYEIYGQGPALVFAHGAGGNSASWYQQVPFFSQDYTTLVFDHRGFGRSRFNEDEFSSHFLLSKNTRCCAIFVSFCAVALRAF